MKLGKKSRTLGAHPLLAQAIRNFVRLNHRLPKLKSRLFDVFLRALRAAESTYVVYATACVYREMYGKITDSLKSGK